MVEPTKGDAPDLAGVEGTQGSLANGQQALRASCWCKNDDFRPFGSDYLECVSCGTLVSQKGLSSEELSVVDDESDYYGKKYWLTHQEADYRYPGFGSRVRTDLPERNLHWLKTLLKYSLPPSRVVELGCAHGSFVGLMSQAGYAASGVEMSPWVVNSAKETFGIDVQVGPVERLSFEPGSLDVIAMMDVMEHLPDPVSTMGHCLSLLKAEGLLLVQMPNFVEGRSFDDLISVNDPFLEQLKSDEHLYLYSQRATIEFFRRLGAHHIVFEPAIFAHYDMFFVVSRSPLQSHSQGLVEQALMSTPSGRFVLAMLDMKASADQAPILQQQIDASAAELQKQFVRTDELANARNLALAQLADMRANFEAVEKDRESRHEVILRQGAEISALQAEVDRRLKELNLLYPEMDALKNRVHGLEPELADIQVQFSGVEKDRQARLEVIEKQGAEISALQAEVDLRVKELSLLYPELDELKSRTRHLEAELADVQAQFLSVEQDREARLEVIEKQGGEISALQMEIDLRLKELNLLYPEMDELRSRAHFLEAELVDIRAQFSMVERDRAERLEVILSQGAEIAALQQQIHARSKD